MMLKRSETGLTLIETVVVLIALLLFVGIVSTQRINQHNRLLRDATRKENVRLISSKLEEFNKAKHAYPSSLADLSKSGYATSLPLDPKTKKPYQYVVAPTDCMTSMLNCTGYGVSAKLENKNDKDADSVTHVFSISNNL